MPKTKKSTDAASGNDRFFCTCGKIFSTPKELYDDLNVSPHACFPYHSNADKSDYANWIRDVFKKKRVSNKMEKRRENKEELCECLKEIC